MKFLSRLRKQFQRYEHERLAWRALYEMSQICGFSNGTIKHPRGLASELMTDGRTLIEAIAEDGSVFYCDEFFVVRVTEKYILIDYNDMELWQLSE